MPKNIAVATDSGNSPSDIGRSYTFEMSRQARLLELINARANGNQADFARLIGRSAAVVWQYVSGHREMGEKLARHIERKLSLPTGWMDELASRDAPAQRQTLASMLDCVISRISEDGETAIDDAAALIDIYLREPDPARRAKLGKILDDLAQPLEQPPVNRQRRSADKSKTAPDQDDDQGPALRLK